jgi:hypothetical protein
MKKILFILMLCVSMVACKKHEIEDVETTPMVTITFDQQIVSSNSMVRSTTNEFLDIIEEQTPDYVNVELVNTDLGKTFTCKSNETITIPIGNYEISASIDGTPKPVGSALWYPIYKTPFLKCDKFSFNVTTSSNKIILNTYYDCYAIFAMIDECKDCKTTLSGETTSFNKYNKYYVCYFQNKNINVTLVPYDDSTEFITTTYNFSTTYDVNKIYAEYGKYYVIHPQKVDKTSCSFNVNITDMQEGEI